MTQIHWLMTFIHMMRMIGPKRKVNPKSPKKSRWKRPKTVTKDSSDDNNTEEQNKLGIDIQMIGAREEKLGRTRSQNQEMMSPTNESME